MKKWGVKDSDTLELDDGIGNFIRAVSIASAINPKVFERLDKSVLKTFAGDVFVLNGCVDYTPPEVTERIIASLDAVFCILKEFLDHRVLHSTVLLRKMRKDAASQVGVEPMGSSPDAPIEANAASGNQPAIATVEAASILIDGENCGTVKDPPDGIDDLLMVFRWGGRVVEGLTPNGFDVLKAMWAFMDNQEHRVRRVDVAAFLPNRMATWKYDPDLENFSKYQTEILKAFEIAEMPCPWKFDTRTRHYVKSDVYRRVDSR